MAGQEEPVVSAANPDSTLASAWLIGECAAREPAGAAAYVRAFAQLPGAADLRRFIAAVQTASLAAAIAALPAAYLGFGAWLGAPPNAAWAAAFGAALAGGSADASEPRPR